MNDREKLIDLLEKAVDYSYILRELQRTTNNAEENQFGVMSDFLLANGVTIQRWIPVTDRLPEDGEVVLAYCNKGSCTAEFRLYGECRHFHIVGYKNCTVTHWMPLPTPPKEVE